MPLDNKFDLNRWKHKATTLGHLTADLLQRDGKEPFQVEVTRYEGNVTEHAPYNARITNSKGERVVDITFERGYLWEYDLPTAFFHDFAPEHAEAINHVAAIYAQTQSDDWCKDNGILEWGGSMACKTGRSERVIRLGEYVSEHLEAQRKEKEIYRKFKGIGFSSYIEIEKISPAAAIAEGQNGYIVLLRHPEEVVGPVTEHSQKIAQVIPSITYDDRNMHTTAITALVQPGVAEPDNEILNVLCRTVQYENRSSLLVRSITPLIEYRNEFKNNSWGYNKDTVIVKGKPNLMFTHLIQTLVHNFEELKDPNHSDVEEITFDLNPSWGSHITAARFLEEASPEQVEELERLIKVAPVVGVGKPTHLEVGHFNLDQEGFRIETYERFDFLL
tara:strand:+ start:784 stop:1950 length:1167 start_codon:yes stop_codon:yes gene_type:complete